MEIIYRANDDTEFTNKEDCINYEKELAEIYDLSNVTMLDQKMEILNTNTKDEVIFAIGRVFYFSVKTEEDYKKVVELFYKEEMSDNFPIYDKKYEGKQTIYAYDYKYGEKDDWTNLNELLEKMQEDFEEIEQKFVKKEGK